MTSIRDHIGVHANALILREKRNEMLASNIANAATPHYKARDIDFASELDSVSGKGDLRTSHTQHMGGAGFGTAHVQYRDPTNASLDGNTVELAVEQMEFSENTVRYQASLQLLNNKIQGLMRAIRGE